jgi:hypothetical protein
VARFANRVSESVNGSKSGATPDTGVVGTRFPALGEYLTLDRWDDDSDRRTSTLLLFCEAGRWTACLNDRECGRSAWASGETPEAALEALEDSLANDCAAWRMSGQNRSQKRGK